VHTLPPPKNRAEVLLVDDNPADIDLMREILGSCKHHYHVNSVGDGEEAILFLHRRGKYSEAPCPDLVILDLNLPRKDGRTVLKELKSDSLFCKIPVVVFTTSQTNSDITNSYQLGANCYLRKPGNLNEYRAVVQSMANFWLGFAALPQ
jgi:two-component system response regulator